jgi:hypothetical protein
LLDQLGDTDYWVDDMPDDVYPEVYWDETPAAKELQRLTDLYGCQICLGADNIVRLAAAQEDTSETIPGPEQRITGDWDYDRSAPSKIHVIGAPILYQNHFWCKPIGLYWPADEDRPRWGDINENPKGGPLEYTGIADLPFSWIGLNSTSEQLRAQISYYHHWLPYCLADGQDSLEIADSISGATVSWELIVHFLPALPAADHAEEFESDVGFGSGVMDMRRPRSSYVSYSNSLHQYGYNPLASHPDFPDGIRRGQDLPVTVNHHSRYVTTPVPLAEERIAVVLAHHMHDEQGALLRYRYTHELEGGEGHEISLDSSDIIMHVIGDWDADAASYGYATNKPDCDTQAKRIAESYVRRYAAPSQQQRYPGFMTLSPNRVVTEVHWFMQYLQPAFTHVSYRTFA